ncbi:hypothetical protein CRUP_006366 [Coryphaenoides rupestris]|nr:hypothetical protein CRUP_006366 [Coryphaenoides rupestris]
MLTWDTGDLLPPGLEPPERGDTYYCMLFNDEVHTYEQVIYTLQKAVNCTQKEAVSFATTVDREGRKSVRFGDFQFCEQAKSVIVRNTSRQSRPLKVQVMHSSVVAHQCFALRTLTWLGHIIGYSDGLRRVLCQVGLQNGPEGENSSLVDTLMLCDSKMWKGARNVYHQLLMNSLLMDLKYKKLFAIQFAKNYESLQSDYVRDDHDREYSITDLSVQIFTVPSLARMLMVEENLMTTIIRTFVDHLRHRDLQGRFQFERYTALQAFKFRRVQSLIGDLKYVLITRPTEWSDQLREKFLEGLDAFLELLKCMQRVLIEAYKKCLAALSQCHGGFTDGEQPISLSLAGHMVDTIRYQVSQERVSIHLPVSRLLAGLHVLLSKTDLANRYPEQLPLSELSPPMLIEHPLRCLVLCAQVHAGMWRRNGFSLINQIYYYHNVKCRVEMFDKDIIMLQREIIHQLSIRPMAHSELVKALPENENKETGLERVIGSVALFNGPPKPSGGHWTESMLQRVKAPSNSGSILALLESLQNAPHLEAHKDMIQWVLKDAVTTLALRVPGPGKTAGPPHTNLRHLRNIEANTTHKQRRSPDAQFYESENCRRSHRQQHNGALVANRAIDSDSPAPPHEAPVAATVHIKEFTGTNPCSQMRMNNPSAVPPRTTEPTLQDADESSRPTEARGTIPQRCVVGLMQCDVLLSVISAVLQWTTEPSGGHWTESMLQRVSGCDLSTLTSDPLVSCAAKTPRRRDPWRGYKGPGEAPSNSGSILALLESLQNAPHLEAHKDMIQWVLKMARLRREKVMAQMSEMQKIFIDENKELFQQSHEDSDSPGSSTEHSSIFAEGPEVLVCVGPRLPGPGPRRRQVVTCILCQEEEEVKADGRAMVLAAFVQRSTVLSKNRTRSPPDPERHDPLFMHPDLAYATHTASCGHIMHATCWQRYFEAVQAKEQRRQQRLRVHTSYDVENGEFLCPLCECLSNTVIPLLPPTHSSSPFSSSIQGMITTFGTATYKIGLKVHPNDQDPRVPIMSWASCAYTIQSIGRLSELSGPVRFRLLDRSPSGHRTEPLHQAAVSYCCQTEVEGQDVGACTAHTYSCGAGLGLFLRRGNPLRLCPERYRKIQKLWHQHSVTEEIGHAQEANQSLVGIDWQHL